MQGLYGITQLNAVIIDVFILGQRSADVYVNAVAAVGVYLHICGEPEYNHRNETIHKSRDIAKHRCLY
jgi:hypothetical protein